MPSAKKESDLTAYLTEYSAPIIMDKLDAQEYLEKCEYTEKILENVEELKIKSQAIMDSVQL